MSQVPMFLALNVKPTQGILTFKNGICQKPMGFPTSHSCRFTYMHNIDISLFLSKHNIILLRTLSYCEGGVDGFSQRLLKWHKATVRVDIEHLFGTFTASQLIPDDILIIICSGQLDDTRA